MMIVKAAAPDAAWEMWEAERDLRFLGPQNLIEIPINGHVLDEDERFPWAHHHHVIYLFDTDPVGNPATHRFVRWVAWEDRNQQIHSLVTDGPVYLCNDRGDTVESLPAGGPAVGVTAVG